MEVTVSDKKVGIQAIDLANNSLFVILFVHLYLHLFKYIIIKIFTYLRIEILLYFKSVL